MFEKGNMMDGILLINKPVGITSRDVVNMVSKKFNTKKIGHTGTLDPFADGLLVLTIGKGTKCSQFLEEKVKTYVATLSLGKSTDTLDKDGVIIEEKEVKQYSIEDITSVLESFKGEITQTVPLYSAIRVNGKKLYEYARNGIQVELPSRQITIFDIKLLHYEGNIIRFEVTCSKGTYIRVLGNDIAHKLGTLGHLISLTRKKVGSFLLENSKKVEDITSEDIINIYDALKDGDVAKAKQIAEEIGDKNLTKDWWDENKFSKTGNLNDLDSFRAKNLKDAKKHLRGKYLDDESVEREYLVTEGWLWTG